jgi:hypothetical protein
MICVSLRLVGRNAGLKREGDSRTFIYPKFDDGEKVVGLSFEKRVSRVPAGKASSNATGRIGLIV